MGIPEEIRAAKVEPPGPAGALEAWVRFEALLEAAPAFIIALSPRGTIDYINRTLPHHNKQDVIGSHWLKYFPPERQPVMEEALRAVLETGTTRTFETMTTDQDGTPIWFSSHIGPLYEGETIVGAVLVSRDVSERKRDQAELLAARRMAILGTLAAGVAHEINTPVQFVGHSVAFLRDATKDLLALFDKLHALRRDAIAGVPLDKIIAGAMKAEEEADLPFLRGRIPAAFERCVDGLERVSKIVLSLQEFAHPSQKEMTLVALNHMIKNVLTIAANEYRYVANLETHLGELPLVPCHPGEIGQVILNLVVNAAHAIGDVVRGTDERGTIRVQSRREKDTVVISVSDTGTGIPEAIRSRIFDPFFTTKKVGEGTGQGLTMAWATVTELHGGELTFESEVGKGTTFFVRLPVDGAPSIR